jgi:hypothetical protein
MDYLASPSAQRESSKAFGTGKRWCTIGTKVLESQGRLVVVIRYVVQPALGGDYAIELSSKRSDAAAVEFDARRFMRQNSSRKYKSQRA